MTSLPNDATGDALRRMVNSGSDLTKPMEMDFFVIVPSEAAGDQVARRAQKLGFATKVEPYNDDGEWTCYCTKTIVPRYGKVVKIERALDAMARPFGGSVEGFGSYGNADP